MVGYRVDGPGYIIRGVDGKYYESDDVTFDETTPGRLSTKTSFADVPYVLDDDSTPATIPLRRSPRNKANLSLNLQHDSLLASSFFADQHKSSYIAVPSSTTLAYLSSLSIVDELLSYFSDFSGPHLYDTFSHSFAYSFPSQNLLTFLSTDRRKKWDLTKPPGTFGERRNRPDAAEWDAPEKEELDGFVTKGVWKVVPIPVGVKVIPTNWVYTVKRDPVTNDVVRNKARLVVLGN